MSSTSRLKTLSDKSPQKSSPVSLPERGNAPTTKKLVKARRIQDLTDTKSLLRETLLEKFCNYRWIITSGMTKRSLYELTRKDTHPDTPYKLLSDIGCFAEMAHCIFNARLIWSHIDSLLQPNFPLYYYQGLRGSRLENIIYGKKADIRALVVHRPAEKQIVIAFSGTTTLGQAVHDLISIRSKYTPLRGGESNGEKVHYGFWLLYIGIRARIVDALKKTISKLKHCNIKEVIVTGHSLGGALSSYFILDVIDIFPDLIAMQSSLNKLTLIVYGSPRPGNSALANRYKNSVADFKRSPKNLSYADYSVRMNNDGKLGTGLHIYLEDKAIN